MPTPPEHPNEVTTLNIAAFGAMSDGRSDTIPAVRAALERCRSGGRFRLVFSPGCYAFHPEQAGERYLFVSNNDEGLKRIAFDLTGLEHLEIDGQGAAFLFHGYLNPFLLNGSHGITLRNFSIDFARPFHSEGRIVAAEPGTPDEPGGVEVEFSPEFPYEIRHGVLVFTDGKAPALPAPSVTKDEAVYPYGSLLEFDAARREPAYKARDHWLKNGLAARETGPGRVRFSLPGLTATVGNILVFGPGHRSVPGITISDSSGVCLSGVRIHHCGGMGVVAQRSGDLLLERVEVTPPPGGRRIVSATADATHFANCRGKITLADCLFECQKDDATNIHGIYARIEALTAPDELEARLVHPQQAGFGLFEPGGKVELVHAPDMVAYAEATVASARWINKERVRVFLAQPLDERVTERIAKHDVLARLDQQPEVLITRCRIRNNRARGILPGSRGRTVVEENVFHTPGAAILLEGDACFWFEQAGVRELVIRRNVFDNCNFGVWGTGTIEVASGIRPALRGGSRYHRNILIEENLFRTFGPQTLLKLYCVDGLTFRRNRLEQTAAYPPHRAEDHPPFVVADSENVSVLPPDTCGQKPAA